uniref:Sushi domain-containing protein n=1 Tax=Ciona savignyi TaxID=51511 RepID=H2Y5C8_CIOSA
VAVRCSRPDSVRYASFRPYSRSYAVSATVTYTCRSGYSLSGQSVLTCGADGEWSHDEPTCARVVVKCPAIGAPDNGSIRPTISQQANVGTRVLFTCNDGFRRNGSRDSRCQSNGRWSSSVPTCEPIQCAAPGNVDNGSFEPGTGPYGVSNTVTYTCSDNYVLEGQVVLTCLVSGEWSHDEPTCNPITCNRPDEIAFGSLTTAGDNFEIGETVTYICNDGHEIVGQDVLTCTNTGEWSHDEPTCTRIIQCATPDEPLNGGFSPNQPAYDITEVVTFTCANGFILNGQSQITCQDTGLWSDDEPTCDAITCNRPDEIAFGSLTTAGDNFEIGETVTYVCNDGYEIVGQDVLTCTVTGEWSHDEPTCTRIIQCATPDEPLNGGFSPNQPAYDITDVVTFTCADGFILNGQSQITCQDTGLWSDDEPICDAITCNRPDEIAFGSLTTAGDNFEIGETVTYVCNDGYEIVGQDVLTCTVTGEWSHDEPTCTRIIQCATPDEPLNGGFSPNQPAYDITEVVTFTCADGFILNGQSQITCEDTGLWSDDEPTCDAITCNRPDEIAFGSLTTAGDNFEIGETVTYTCNDGYEIAGQDVLTCTVTGEWSHDEPTCTRIIQCATPDEPLNGGFSPNQLAYDITDVVTFTCADGFILNGQSQITCEDTGLWSDDEPTCDRKIIQCATPDEPLNGGFSPNQPAYDITEVVTFTCADGFILNGQSQITCQDTGLWSDDEPICDAITCNRPDEIAFGSLTTAGERFEIDETVTYICNDGYEIVGQNVLTCTVTGEWSHDEPTCTRIIQCATPDEPLNGGFSPNQPAYDITEVVTFTCANGFILNGQSQITCEDTGLWSDDEPTCDAITCNRPDEIAFGSLTTAGESFEIGETVTYICNDGYEIVGQNVLTCTVTGEWSHDEPTCTRIIQCATPDEPLNGGFSPNQPAYDITEVVTFTCADGFILNGQSQITCEDTGVWSDDEPTCDPIQCAAPGNVDNGSFEPGTGPYSVSDTVTYTCSGNYVLEGQAVLTCQINGDWSHDEPTCNPIQCATPGDVSNGSFEPDTGPYVVSNTVTYTCSGDYVLEGQAVLTCLVSGEWSHDEPQCVVVTCPIPVEPINGGVTPVQEQYPVNFVIWYTCDTGYTTADRKDAICRPDGTWSDDAPNCVAITCNRPDEISYGSLTTAGNSFEIGETVTYVCNDGYEIVGQGVLTCTNTGEWSHDEPTCQRVIVPQCASRVSPANGAVSPVQASYDANSEVTFTCTTGYRLVGSSSSTCLSTGLWDTEVPSC